MLKKILVTAIVAACALGSLAEETLYLIKGDRVVAKYNVEDVDYAAFELPAGVQDLQPAFQEGQFISALGVYYGTTDEIADFQIQLSTRQVSDENVPVQLLYLQFMAPAADYKNLHLNEGTYTLGSSDVRKPFTFYAGIREQTPQGEGVGGSLLLDKPNPETIIATLVTGGQFNIAESDNGYAISGILKLENGSVIEFNYDGPCVIDNQSDEKDPADEIPVPESKLTSDVEIPAIAEAYAVAWPRFFADNPQFDYIYMLLYGDAVNYSQQLQIGLIVDRDKHPGVILPKGKYPVIERTAAAMESADLATMPAFRVKGETSLADYGCWYAPEYELNPLVAGEVEVLEDCVDLNDVKIRVSLRDNAAEPHTVTASFDGHLNPF